MTRKSNQEEERAWENFQRRMDRLSSEAAEKMETLKNLDIFILDNSIRETTVASLKAHTVAGKRAIWEEVKKCGFKYYFIESFNSQNRIGELFLTELIEEGADISGAVAFSEVWEKITDSVPQMDPVPIGMQKCEKYGVKHVCFEVDLAYFAVNYSKFTMDHLCKMLEARVRWVRKHLSPDSLIFLNLRDFAMSMRNHPQRIFKVVRHLARLDDRIMGLAYEDLGDSFSHELAGWTAAVRAEMMRLGWTDGHLLFHGHEQWSTVHATNLDCLAAGATGMWAGVCKLGAGMGHADSTTAILNLVKLGNTRVLRRYNCKYLREAAIKVTKAVTGKPPEPMQPIYGARALDMVFGFLFTNRENDPAYREGFDLAEFLGVEKKVRISNMANAEMIVMRLKSEFGEDPQFTRQRAEEMRTQILENAAAGRKEEYNSRVGLAMLFDQAGGKMTAAMADEISESNRGRKRVQELIAEIKEKWDRWDGRDGEPVDGALLFEHFYEGFMAPYFGCYRCKDTRKALASVDMDKDGLVDWNEFKVYLVWAGREYPRVDDAQDLLDKAFRFGIIPAMLD